MADKSFARGGVQSEAGQVAANSHIMQRHLPKREVPDKSPLAISGADLTALRNVHENVAAAPINLSIEGA